MIERTGGFHGLYHVLHGVISPSDGIGPEDLKIQELVTNSARVRAVYLQTAEGVSCSPRLSFAFSFMTLKAADVTRVGLHA